MKSLIYAAIIATLLASCSFAADRACITVSRCSKAPIIDGKIALNEWKDAAAISNFLDSDGISTANPNSTAYIMADNNTLYVAVRMPEPDSKGPSGFVRTYDDKIGDDDCAQVFLAPEDMTKAKEATVSFGGYEGSFDNWYTDIKSYYQFAVNCMGSKLDSRNDVRAWSAKWTAKVGREKGAWTAEFAIPFSSVGAKNCPWNTLWGINIFRYRHFQRSGLANSYYGGYTSMPVGVIMFSPDKILVRQKVTSKPKAGKNNLDFELVNNTQAPANITLTVTSPESSPEKLTISLAVNETKPLKAVYTLPEEGNVSASYNIKVNDTAIPLIQGNVGAAFPSKLQTNLRYFALTKEVRADIEILPGSKASKAVLTVNSPSGEKTKEVNLTKSKGTTIKLPITGNPGDKYSSKLVVTSADGKALSEKSFETIIPPHYSWQGTKAGLPLKVLPPWTPLKVNGKKLSIMGRTITYTDSALPDQVVSIGKSMLKAPIRLVVKKGSRELTWLQKSCKLIAHDDTHARFRSIWKGKDFDLTITSTVEYDGFSWNEAALIPHGSQKVDSVSLEATLDSSVAKYYCQSSSRSGGKISPVGLRIPIGWNNHFWVGDERRGISWLYESDEWIKSAKDSSQIQVIPGKLGSLWKNSIIDKKTVVSSPYKMQFALQYTPAKEIPLEKNYTYHTGAEWSLITAKEQSQSTISAPGNINTDKGTLECWVKPTFDTNETYDPAKDLSVYNRQFLTFTTSTNEALILYYNAIARNFIALKRNVEGKYTMYLAGGDSRLATDQWTYIALSWGDKVRLQINNVVREFDMQGLVAGDISRSPLNFNINDFKLDDLRISKVQRPTGLVPTSPLIADADTLLLHSFDSINTPEKVTSSGSSFSLIGCKSIPGKFGNAIAIGDPLLRIDSLEQLGTKVIIFHEDWSRFQGYPDLTRIVKLKEIADACHARGMRFIIYFNQDMSDADPEWKGMEYDFGLGGIMLNYRREYDEIKQLCYNACVNGPFGDLLLDGIAKITDEAGIDGVYMDGTSVAWSCNNPTHPGCGQAQGDGKYLTHVPIRATRQFLKRLRNIFVQRGKNVYMTAHTGSSIDVTTNGLCDAYLDGEALAGFKKGYMLEPGEYVAAYMGNNYGVRGEFLPGKFTVDEGLALSLVHDTETRYQPFQVTQALERFDDKQTTFIPYWDKSSLYKVTPGNILASVYLKKNSALIVMGSQTTEPTTATLNINNLLKKLPDGAIIRDIMTGEDLTPASGVLTLNMPGRGWKGLEILHKQ